MQLLEGHVNPTRGPATHRPATNLFCISGQQHTGQLLARRNRVSFRQQRQVIHQNVLGLKQRSIRGRRFLGFRLVGIIPAWARLRRLNW